MLFKKIISFMGILGLVLALASCKNNQNDEEQTVTIPSEVLVQIEADLVVLEANGYVAISTSQEMDVMGQNIFSANDYKNGDLVSYTYAFKQNENEIMIYYFAEDALTVKYRTEGAKTVKNALVYGDSDNIIK